MRSNLAAVLVTLAAPLCGAACGGSSPTPLSGASALHVKPPGEARVGDTSRCPVSGETFIVSDDSQKVEHQGKTYYFCCADCVARFRANPQQYIGRI